jgi:hypothetical protein
MKRSNIVDPFLSVADTWKSFRILLEESYAPVLPICWSCSHKRRMSLSQRIIFFLEEHYFYGTTTAIKVLLGSGLRIGCIFPVLPVSTLAWE